MRQNMSLAPCFLVLLLPCLSVVLAGTSQRQRACDDTAGQMWGSIEASVTLVVLPGRPFSGAYFKLKFPKRIF